MSTTTRGREGEQGFALLITVFLVLLLSFLVLISIGHSGDEQVSGARARSASRALHAADAGIQLAISRIAQDPPDMTELDCPMGGLTVRPGRSSLTTGAG